MQIQIGWLLQKPTDLDLHCLQRQDISRFSRTRVKIVIMFIKLYFLTHLSCVPYRACSCVCLLTFIHWIQSLADNIFFLSFRQKYGLVFHVNCLLMANIVKPDQLLHNAMSNQVQHCLPLKESHEMLNPIFWEKKRKNRNFVTCLSCAFCCRSSEG